MNSHIREGSTVPVSYKTPAYLLIAKYGKGRAVDRGRQNYAKIKSKHLPFWKWTFRNGK